MYGKELTTAVCRSCSKRCLVSTERASGECGASLWKKPVIYSPTTTIYDKPRPSLCRGSLVQCENETSNCTWREIFHGEDIDPKLKYVNYTLNAIDFDIEKTSSDSMPRMMHVTVHCLAHLTLVIPRQRMTKVTFWTKRHANFRN